MLRKQMASAADLYCYLFEHTIDYAVLLLDPGGTIIGWNAGAERLFGWTAPEAIGQDTALIFTPEDTDQDVPASELQTATIVGRAADERWHLRKDGTRFWATGVLTQVHDHSEELV